MGFALYKEMQGNKSRRRRRGSTARNRLPAVAVAFRVGFRIGLGVLHAGTLGPAAGPLNPFQNPARNNASIRALVRFFGVASLTLGVWKLALLNQQGGGVEKRLMFNDLVVSHAPANGTFEYDVLRALSGLIGGLVVGFNLE